jgi:iron complex transport system permease protein
LTTIAAHAPLSHRRHPQARWTAVGVVCVVAVVVLGVSVGAVGINPWRALLEVFDHIPGVSVDSGLTVRQAAIVWQLRFPRVILGLLVGALLSTSGASYQGVFRNPLADPYLLGTAAGAGLGATIAIAAGATVTAGILSPVPLAAFAGAIVAVLMTYAIGVVGDRTRSPASLLLAGVAVAAFLTAVQTFVQQRHSDTIREVYSWILGRLAVAGWNEVRMLVPYTVITLGVMIALRRNLDVLAVGDDEAASLGLRPDRIRLLVVVTATLATAAAVSVSGLIGFVGIIVPHAVRLLVGSSNRMVLPLSALFGGAFLVLADVIARTADSPAEIPIGVVTAMIGAPFFVVVLRTSRVER